MDNRKVIENVSLQFLRECFTLEEKTGELFWKVRPVSHFSCLRSANATNKMKAGSRVGSKAHNRRRFMIHLMGKYYLLHRIVYALSNGVEPSELPVIVDHIDGDEANNRPSNLRPANYLESTMNRGRMGRSKHDAKGAVMDTPESWHARIICRGERYYLGSFPTKEEAAAAYIGAARILHGEFFRDPRTQAAA